MVIFAWLCLETSFEKMSQSVKFIVFLSIFPTLIKNRIKILLKQVNFYGLNLLKIYSILIMTIQSKIESSVSLVPIDVKSAGILGL